MNLRIFSHRIVANGRDSLDSPLLLPNSSKDVLRWVRGVIQGLEWELGDVPPLDRLPACGRRDAEEVDIFTIWLGTGKEVPPYNPRATPA